MPSERAVTVASKPAVIFGSGGHARVVASLCGRPEDAITFVVPQARSAGQLAEADVFDRLDDFAQADLYIGIGDNAVRIRLFEALAARGRKPATLVAPNAFVADSASLGAGALVCPGSAVMAGAVLGDNALVNTLSSVDHDSLLGDHCQLAPGVTFAGATRVGRNGFFGVKSATIPGVELGDNVTVMAGSLVTKSFGDDLVLGGVPARIARRRANDAPGATESP